MGTHVIGPQLSEEQAAATALAARMNAEARDNWHDPAWRHAMAAELTTQVWWGFEHENLLEYFTTVERAEVGDRITIEEVYGAEVFWVSLGGQIDQTYMTEDVFELRPDYVGFHVSEYDDRMRTKFARLSQIAVQSGVAQTDAAISSRLFRMFQEAIPGPASEFFITSGGIDQDLLDAALTDVQEESLTGECAIVGRASMIDQIIRLVRDSGGFTPETNEQIIQLGVMGRYMGVPLVKLRNYRDRNRQPYFPKNELMIVAKDASKVGFWGGFEAKEGSEQFGWYWHYMGRRSAGMAVWRPESARRYVDTNLAAA